MLALFLIVCIFFVGHSTCASLSANAEDHDLFILGIPDGGQLTCDLSLQLGVAGRFSAEFIDTALSTFVTAVDPVPGTCTLSLYRIEYEEAGERWWSSEQEPGAAHPVELVEGDYAVYRDDDFLPITFDITFALNTVSAGYVTVPHFCPGGLSSSEAALPTYFFGVLCELETGEAMTGVTPRFTASLPLVPVLPSPGATLFVGQSFDMRVAFSRALPQLVPFGVTHSVTAWHATDNIPGFTGVPYNVQHVPQDIPPFGTLYQVTKPTFTVLGIDLTSVHLRVDWTLPDIDLDDPRFFLTYHLDLPGAAYNVTFPVTSLSSRRGYACNMASLAAYFSQRSYGIENSVVFGREYSKVSPLRSCVSASDHTTPFSLIPMVLFSRGKLHMSIHGTPKLVNFVMDEPDESLSGAQDSTRLLGPNDNSMLLVTFRGTEGYFSDWWTNLKATTVDCDDVAYPCSVLDDDDDSSGQIHQGFFEEYEAVRSLLIRIYARLLARHHTEIGHLTILFTGHSQGGALATLAELEAAFQFKTVDAIEVGAITFGAPRVGFGDFHEMHDRLVGRDFHWRIEADNDPVVSVPPVYEHVGRSFGVSCNHWLLRHKCHSFFGYLEKTLQDRSSDFIFPWPGVVLFTDEHRLVLPFRDAEEESGAGLSSAAIVAIVAAAVCYVALLAVCMGASILVLARRRRSSTASLHPTCAAATASPSTNPHRTVRRTSSRRIRKSPATSKRALHATNA